MFKLNSPVLPGSMLARSFGGVNHFLWADQVGAAGGELIAVIKVMQGVATKAVEGEFNSIHLDCTI